LSVVLSAGSSDCEDKLYMVWF